MAGERRGRCQVAARQARARGKGIGLLSRAWRREWRRRPGLAWPATNWLLQPAVGGRGCREEASREREVGGMKGRGREEEGRREGGGGC